MRPIRHMKKVVMISALLLVGVATIAPLLVSMRRHEEELKALSFTDELTDLYNRRGLGTLADHLIAQADRAISALATRPRSSRDATS